MKESMRTYVPGTRTAPIQYEESRTSLEKPKEHTLIYQPVRQGNRKYPVSPIYSKKEISVEEIQSKEQQSTLEEKGPSFVLRKNK